MEKFKKFEIQSQKSIFGGFTIHNTCWDDKEGHERSDTYDDVTGEMTYE